MLFPSLFLHFVLFFPLLSAKALPLPPTSPLPSTPRNVTISLYTHSSNGVKNVASTTCPNLPPHACCGAHQTALYTHATITGLGMNDVATAWGWRVVGETAHQRRSNTGAMVTVREDLHPQYGFCGRWSMGSVRGDRVREEGGGKGRSKGTEKKDEEGTASGNEARHGIEGTEEEETGEIVLQPPQRIVGVSWSPYIYPHNPSNVVGPPQQRPIS